MLFAEGTDLYWARSRVLEYLNSASGDLPRRYGLSSVQTRPGVGWVFQYAVLGEGYSFEELRSLQDWHIRFELQSVPGVSEVASVGGFVRQYQVILDPAKLLGFGITAGEVVRAMRSPTPMWRTHHRGRRRRLHGSWTPGIYAG